ncbi:MAG: peptidoglycan DD-metalloendopeptidase family protein [Magnetococcales bacterium]|nr:peptidoglycan DD-metalloendopeptidase family protein [Magnetococcales bacterium]
MRPSPAWWRGAVWLAWLWCVAAPGRLGAVSEIDNQEHATLERSRVQLNRTVRDLVREQLALREAKGETESLLDELERLDRSLSDKERKQAELLTRQEETLKQLPEVEERIATNRKKLVVQRRRLAQHLRLMYELGNQGPLKTVFAHQESSHGQQGMLYYGRLIQARNQEFVDFRIAIARMRNDLAKSRELAETLALLSADLTKEQKQLQEERLKRARFLEQARSEEKQHQRKVEELTRAKIQLSAFLERLSGYLDGESPLAPETSPDEPPDDPPAGEGPQSPKAAKPPAKGPPSATAAIRSRRGQLSPPVPGRSEKRPPGLFFKVAAHTPIAAIHAGQVVYADWFRGYGLLLIIKHDEHVYSLYGHNNKLLVAQGDLVKGQEVIAQSGDSGALDGVPGLYFEIRIQGKTVNPTGWLADQG